MWVTGPRGRIEIDSERPLGKFLSEGARLPSSRVYPPLAIEPGINYRIYKFDPHSFRFRYVLAFNSQTASASFEGVQLRDRFYSYKDLGLTLDAECVDAFVTAFPQRRT
jgi:hypothetical protein